jgi:ParB-like chromosome segregation protein Spo0J
MGSQRLALLKLSPDMQKHLSSGDLLVRDARRLARLDPVEQLPAWRPEQEAAALQDEAQPSSRRVAAATSTGGAEGASDTTSATPRAGRDPAASAVAALGATPEAIAKTLREFLAPADRRRLAELLVT